MTIGSLIMTIDMHGFVRGYFRFMERAEVSSTVRSIFIKMLTESLILFLGVGKAP